MLNVTSPINYRGTRIACYTGYVVQAMVINFVPLLYAFFQSFFGWSLTDISFLVFLNFFIQLCTDASSIRLINQFGYRKIAVMANVLVCIGLVMLAILPQVLSASYVGLVLSIVVFSFGGGLTEVTINPIMAQLPTANSQKALSFLSVFYSWGTVGIILTSTLYFKITTIQNWPFLALSFALVPLYNAISLARVAMPVTATSFQTTSYRSLLSSRVFALLVVFILCAGASEMIVGQWISLFMEQNLNVSKSMGDLAGALLFASMMGLSRWIYGCYGHLISLTKFMLGSSILTVVSMLLIVSPLHPLINFIGCGTYGLAVGILWPGTYALAQQHFPTGGSRLFGLLAIAGHLGCAIGPSIVGTVASASGQNLNLGFMTGILFPLILLGNLLVYRNIRKSQRWLKDEMNSIY